MPVEIKLTKGYTAVVDDVDADLAAWSWYASVQHSTYAARRYFLGPGKSEIRLMHRVILARMLGRELASGEYVDHINHLGTDNRRVNLRLASSTQINRRPSPLSDSLRITGRCV